jgi:hypothetical protein
MRCIYRLHLRAGWIDYPAFEEDSGADARRFSEQQVQLW